MGISNISDYHYLRFKYSPVKKKVSLIIVTFVLVHTGIAQQIYLTHTGLASFVSEAPLEVIRAKSSEVSGAINLAERTFAFFIDNKSFKGFNSSLQQEHFYENYMEAQQYPTSSFKGRIIEEIGLNPGQEQTVRAKGLLDIHGVIQERIIKGTIKILDNKIQLDADFTVLLEDHGIKIPRVVYQKIAEEIKISVSAELIRKTE
jgi:polyisoprenoid-binding protein YceI